MNNEKNTIRDGIIVTVVSGIILAILAWIFDGVTEAIKSVVNWLLSVANYIKQGFVFVWEYFQRPTITPVGLLWLFIILSIVALWKVFSPTINPLVKTQKSSKPYKPRLDDYRQDIVFNIRWEWSHIFDTMPSEPAGFCPDCLTRLVYSEHDYPEKTSFICQSCKQTLATLDGSLDFALSTVSRQIESRIKTEEWKNIVIRQHNQKTG